MTDQAINLRLLDRDPRTRGDLLLELGEDYLFALGYADCRRKSHSPGREIDLDARHRTERRRALAECKATEARVGGSDINKFAGALQSEIDDEPSLETTGYFISLRGFKTSAIRQEERTTRSILLVTGADLLNELVRSRVVVEPAVAHERAGRSAVGLDASLVPSGSELLVLPFARVWVVYFGIAGKRTHFSLIHADGNPLPADLADRVVTEDKYVRGGLSGLTHVAPPAESSVGDRSLKAALVRYRAHLIREHGTLTLDGLPAIQDVASRPVPLEALFVPLHLELVGRDSPMLSGHAPLAVSSRTDQHATGGRALESVDPVADAEGRVTLGRALRRDLRIAVLAGPGAGKTTLLKRVATAYTSPAKLRAADDDLPSADWLPLFLRCRQLGTLAKGPVIDALRAIPASAEMTSVESQAFGELLEAALQRGNALLLVDGIDEIADPSERTRFVIQLRTFLATYPGVGAVVTSRPAGFRVVANSLQAVCRHYTLADLDDEGIRSLTLAWYSTLAGESPALDIEARELADVILTSDRLRQLATNPLLLTTLLLVKRWIGELPRKRSALYAKAVEVLLATWNIEGHEPIDADEAIPQLAYLAFAMMSTGASSVSGRQLAALLQEARRQMPETLGFARVPVSEFLDRVEYRSSVLSLAGHYYRDGVLQPAYEFKHATFQEYFAAVAAVHGFYPGRTATDSILVPLGRHLRDPRWQEVVLIASILAGRDAAPLIREILTPEAGVDHSVTRPQPPFRHPMSVTLLADALTDEVQIAPTLVREVCEFIVANHGHADGFILESRLAGILSSKYSATFRVSARDASFARQNETAAAALEIVAAVMLHDLDRTDGLHSEQSTPETRAGWPAPTAASAVSTLSALAKGRATGGELGTDSLAALLDSGDDATLQIACIAVSWLRRRRLLKFDEIDVLHKHVLNAWCRAETPIARQWAAHALVRLGVHARVDSGALLDRDLMEFLRSEAEADLDGWPRDRKAAALFTAYMTRGPWSDTDLVELVVDELTNRRHVATTREALRSLLGHIGPLDAKGFAALGCQVESPDPVRR